MDIKKQALIEKVYRELEKRYKPQRESVVEYIKLHHEQEYNKPFDDNWHYYEIEKQLLDIMAWNGKILIINVPPGSGKTMLITKFFPVWYMWNQEDVEVIATGYSWDLTQQYWSEAKDIYKSKTFKRCFPRRPWIRPDFDSKSLWKTEKWWTYRATGTWGIITGTRCRLFLIDDPIKPDEADNSDVKRQWVNNWFDNTVISRLYNPKKDSIVIIMQRTHENDLCWHILDKKKRWLMRNTEVVHLNFPAIAETGDDFRGIWEALQVNRYPIDTLQLIKESMSPVSWSCQYQQNPIAKESQEFHEEWFKYYDEFPKTWRIFTTVDPAFSKRDSADCSAIVTWRFIGDELYILEYTNARLNPGELNDKIIYHIRKRQPEKVGIEAFQAQTVITHSLKNELQKIWLSVWLEEIKQHQDKETKIRKLIPLYRNGLIYHRRGMEELEDQLVKFPRAIHDDLIDALQMLYDMYTLQPNTNVSNPIPKVEYYDDWTPRITTQYHDHLDDWW